MPRLEKEIAPEFKALFLFLKSDWVISGNRVHLIRLETKGESPNREDSVWRFLVGDKEELVSLKTLAEWAKQIPEEEKE